MIMKKRGQVETPINWVFVLIAGAIILLFFSIVIYRIQGTAQKQSEASLITNINSILSGIGLSSSTSVLIEDLPSRNAFFSCQGYNLEGAAGIYDQRLTFAPNSLNIQRLVLWTNAFNMPFFISNFLYVSSPDIRYIFVYDDSSASQNIRNRIGKLIPESISQEFITNAALAKESGFADA